jgi:uncharacterized membrane protein YkvA (DUF1232 family)
MQKSGFIAFWKQKARALERQVAALYYAYRDPRTPWYARAFAALVVAYAFSPIDLIPDFIPVLGYLDDLVLVPLGVWLALKMVPPPVMADCRVRAEAGLGQGKFQFKFMAAIIIALWVLVLALVVLWIIRATN